MRKPYGIVLVEVLIAAGILSLIIHPLLCLTVVGLESNSFSSKEIKAESLLVEQVEGVRSIRNRSWSELSPGAYYISIIDGLWQLVASETGVQDGIYTKKIEIQPVWRNLSDEIVAEEEPGSVFDPSTLEMVVTINWRLIRDRELAMNFYLTRYEENMTWTQTTQAEFDAGELEYAETTLISDGEVQLEGGCFQNPDDGPLIFTDQFYNTWQIFPSAKAELRVVSSSQGEVYEGNYSLELSNFAGANTKLRNFNNRCTLGFTRFEFWAYNSAVIDQSFGIHVNWDGGFREVVVPPREWMFISLDYTNVSDGNEINLDFLHFKPFVWQLGTIFYLDEMTLAGGLGGYYAEGTLTSSVHNAGREVVFNRVGFEAELPVNTLIGLQLATSDNANGPWTYYGPGGTTSSSDVYTQPDGEGIWMGNNRGQYVRYRAYLRTSDGEQTPVLEMVTLNYSI